MRPRVEAARRARELEAAALAAALAPLHLRLEARELVVVGLGEEHDVDEGDALNRCWADVRGLGVGGRVEELLGADVAKVVVVALREGVG